MSLPKPYYDDGEGRVIYHGDCLDVLREADPGLAHVCVTDPPYNVGIPYRSYCDRQPEADYLDWLGCRFTAVARCLEANAALVWFWQGIRVANGEVLRVLPSDWQLHHIAAWHRREFAGDLWKSAHPAFTWEPIIWAVNGEAVYHGPRGANGGRDLIIGNSHRHDVGTGGHPCPKPLSVIQTLVRWIAPEGATVLDPFAGSGTVLYAARALGCRAIGIELDESYCEIAAQRLAQGVFEFSGCDRD